ncbi:phospholipid carrier-dependent glycosyltransferase [Candidatus Nomurabacteria bacterium]|uniref:Phospholipid carrier-dependent glycosyltransferase n=1 Tax=candidate division WWE3 bacterium TaxID=2053526 RepID=A0A955E028_UNCKA|nr:phospholipid carrier-dependent glycosyltransferase [candidate division WWE3 bacterium]MCB9823408.1 phospholipid carrier-dependent glycosyltransferase [Candidatus Nomurabacteria bacterium]MCB9827690.1 phospholipid carrier-dependent glycosyltransferase [Candidatus Nomurabacteria bacterium]HXK52556.1 glycosyltransferase family 39 protein [bacterium]
MNKYLKTAAGLYSRPVSKISRIKIINILIIISLLFFGGFLRFSNLGYSEFQDDEKKAVVRKINGETTAEFLLNQRKGPLQFAVTSATLLINQNKSELVLRAPFTFLNLLSIVVVYFLLKEITGSKTAGFFGAFIFLTNGFIVGFSRIAQYQNLNIFFSLLSLLFYRNLVTKQTKLALYSVLGTICFSLSVLAHWDAVFFIVPIVYFYIVFLIRKDITKRSKLIITSINFLAGSFVILPFLLPYLNNLSANSGNLEYFDKRMGLLAYPLSRHKYIFELYNPFYALYFIGALSAIAIFKIKQSWPYMMWLIINFAGIFIFMEKPGTHIYNYFIPAIFLTSFGISALAKNKHIFILFLLPLALSVSFLYLQSYKIFVDHKQEYPWDSKTIITLFGTKYDTKIYDDKEVLTFGFPHFRNWKEVNEIIKSDKDGCSYITNEGKEISQIYVEEKYGILNSRRCYYIVQVVKPFITRGNGAKFAKISGKSPVYTYKKDGETLLKMYRIDNKNFK